MLEVFSVIFEVAKFIFAAVAVLFVTAVAMYLVVKATQAAFKGVPGWVAPIAATALLLLIIAAAGGARAEKLAGTIEGIDFTTGEVYANCHGTIFVWYEDSIDEDDVLFGDDVIVDEKGNELIKLGCRAVLTIEDGEVIGRKLTPLFIKTKRVYYLEDIEDRNTILGYASSPEVATYIMVARECAIEPVDMVYSY